jgi:vacuolar-type H+-ATPase subunit H
MEIVTGQGSTDGIDPAIRVGEAVPGQDLPEQVTTGIQLLSPSSIRARRRRSYAKLPGPKTTWVWDRTRQAWMEIIESPAGQDLPGSDPPAPEAASIHTSSLVLAPLPQRTQQPAPSPRVRSIRTSLSRVLDALILKARPSQPAPVQATPTEPVEIRETRVVASTRQSPQDLAAMIVERATQEARQTLAEAGEKALELREKARREVELSASNSIAAAELLSRGIAKATEEQAEARAETILAQAEEKSKARADGIVAKALQAAEAAAGDVIAEAGARSRARAESIVNQLIARAEAEAKAIVAQAEDKARARAETIMAATEQTCRRRLSEAEAQSRWMIEAAEIQSRDASAPAPYTPQALPQPKADRAPAPFEQTATPTLAPTPTPPPVESRPTQVTEKRARGGPQAIRDGRVELIIKHPVNLSRMQKMLNRLAKHPEIRVIDLAGSPRKGVTVKLYSYQLGRLPNVLQGLPEVSTVAQLPVKSSRICPTERICRSLGSGPPVTRLLVTLGGDDLLDI